MEQNIKKEMFEKNEKNTIVLEIKSRVEFVGPYPALSDLKQWMKYLKPNEYANSVLMLETYLMSEKFRSFQNKKLFSNQNLESSIQNQEAIIKLFLSIVRHYSKQEEQASDIMGEILHYFYQSLIELCLKKNFLSLN